MMGVGIYGKLYFFFKKKGQWIWGGREYKGKYLGVLIEKSLPYGEIAYRIFINNKIKIKITIIPIAS
jgi:hypothetical protein